VGGERIELAHFGTNHTPDNSTSTSRVTMRLMLVDVVLPGWVPFQNFNIDEDVPGSIAAPDKALAYPWKHFIGGHMGGWARARTWPCTRSTSPTSSKA